MKKDGGCDFRNIVSGYCTNTGKVMAQNDKICVTTCDKCYYKDSSKLKA